MIQNIAKKLMFSKKNIWILGSLTYKEVEVRAKWSDIHINNKKNTANLLQNLVSHSSDHI
jgi:hypothetical protein